MNHDSAIDHEKKNLYDSVGIIASEDSFILVSELMMVLHQRKEICKEIRRQNLGVEIAVDNLKHYNDRIKHLLNL